MANSNNKRPNAGQVEPMIDFKIIGQRIARSIRINGFLSRSAFARHIEMPKETLRNICNGKPCSLVLLARIAQNLNESLDFLVFGKDAGTDDVVAIAAKIKKLTPEQRILIAALVDQLSK